MKNQNEIDALIKNIDNDNSLDENTKAIILRKLNTLKSAKVNVLITGATGSGKSSTINALFDVEKAKIGQGSTPETMEIAEYELDNIVLFDSPGLGDGKEADVRHAKAIIDKLYQKDEDGELLIDLVLVVLDGSSRDLGTTFELINQVIIPNLGDDKGRLLIAINQADMAMKGRYWDFQKNQPEPELIKFLDEKVASTQRRIKEATGVSVTPICYVAGYKHGNEQQAPWNLSKLLLYILQHVKKEKRAVFVPNINKNPEMWKDDDRLEDYREKVKQTLIESIQECASIGADLGGRLGGFIGSESVGRAVGTVVGGVIGFFKGIFG